MSYTDPFGGSTVQPAQVAYRAVTLTADVSLSWPDTAIDANYVARIMAVTASSGGLSMLMPDARGVSPGYDVIFTNPGANTYTVKDNAGGVICTVPSGVSQYVYVTVNTTAAGVWATLQFGSLTSAVTAASLIGPGIGASGSTLYGKLAVASVSVSFTSTVVDRAKLFIWTGGVGALTLPLSVTAGSDYFFAVANQGSGSITITCAGADTLDGAATLVLGIGESCYLAADGGTKWVSVGRGRTSAFNFTQLAKVISTGTVTLTLAEAQNVVQKYTGVLVGNVNVVLPSTVQVYYVSNQTSGAFNVTFKTAGVGTSVVVPTGQNAVLFCDGTNVLNASTTVSGISALTMSPGSVSVPSINFTTGASTGIYSSASDVFDIATAGVNRIRVDASGNVGIGGVPASKLQIGSGVTNEKIVVKGTVADAEFGNDGTGVRYGTTNAAPVYLVTNGAERMRVDSSGNVGIATTNPLSKLQIGTGVADNKMVIKGTVTDAEFGNDATGVRVGTPNNGPVYFITNSSERLRIDAAGRLLLGRTVDSGLGFFQVNDSVGSIADLASSFAGTSIARVRNSGAQTTGIAVQNSATGTTNTDGTRLLIDSSGNGFLSQAEAAALIFETSATERVRIDANGLVGIGLIPSAGQGLLQLLGSASGGIKLGNTNNATATVLDWYEEGTFTPTAGVTGATYSVQNGIFTRIGNKVKFVIELTWTGGTNGATVAPASLPYTPKSNIQMLVVGANQSNSSFTWTGTLVAWLNGGTTINVAASASGGTWFSLLNPNAGTKDLYISGEYLV
jgi:hypothetical protein